MKLEQLLDVIDVGVVSLDLDMRITGWNSWMVHNSKMLEKDLLGKKLLEVFPGLDKPWFKRNCNSVMKFGSFSFLSQKIHGSCFPFEPVSSFHSDFNLMQQDCTLGPIRNENGKIEQIFILVKDVTQIAVYDKQLISLSEKDGLTGIYNRKFLDRKLRDEFNRHKRYSRNLCLIMMDIDFFKLVNDTWGHSCGDDVLQKTAALVSERTRVHDILARYGGEEFLIILPETILENAILLAESLRELIESEKFYINDKSFSVTVSLGVANLNSNIKDEKELLELVDSALYEAKKSGRNKVVSIS